MSSITHILSTKKLNKQTIATYFDADKFSVDSHDFISISPLPYSKSDLWEQSNHWVVTSKNGFHQLQADFTLDQLKQVHFYVVGQKTAQLIQSNGLKVVHQTNYGQELAEWLVKNHSKNTPLALTVAKKRQATFIHTLEKGRMSFKEYHLYDTILTPIKTNKHYQGLIFYSPSGIESYTSVNPILTDQSLFCIGRTTAQAAKPHSHHIHIASKPSIESVLELTKLHYE